MLVQLRGALQQCAKLLQQWVGQAQQAGKRDMMNWFCTHLGMLQAAELAACMEHQEQHFAESKEIQAEGVTHAAKTMCSSSCYVISNYHDRMDLTHIPVHDLFYALQRKRKPLLQWSEMASQEELDIVLDDVVEMAAPSVLNFIDVKHWSPVQVEQSTKMCTQTIASAHPCQGDAH